MEVKLIRDKHSGFPAGYGFVEFQSRAVAEKVLQSCNGNPIRECPLPPLDTRHDPRRPCLSEILASLGCCPWLCCLSCPLRPGGKEGEERAFTMGGISL